MIFRSCHAAFISTPAFPRTIITHLLLSMIEGGTFCGAEFLSNSSRRSGKTSSGTLSTQPQRSLSSTHDGRVSPRPTGTKIWSSTWSAPRAGPPGFTGPGAVERLPGRLQDAPIRSEFEKARANYARKVMVEIRRLRAQSSRHLSGHDLLNRGESCHPVPALRSGSGGIWVGGGGLRLPGAPASLLKEGEAGELGFPPPEG